MDTYRKEHIQEGTHTGRNIYMSGDIQDVTYTGGDTYRKDHIHEWQLTGRNIYMSGNLHEETYA